MKDSFREDSKKSEVHADPNVLQADRTAILLPPTMFIDIVEKIVERRLSTSWKTTSGLGVFGERAQLFFFIIMRC